MPNTEERVPGEYLRPWYGFPSGEKKHESLRSILNKCGDREFAWKVIGFVTVMDIVLISILVAVLWNGGNS